MRQTALKSLCRAAGAACMLTAALTTAATSAEILVIGGAGDANAVHMNALPPPADMGEALLAARLRAVPVTTLPMTAPQDDVIVVLSAAQGEGGLTLGDEVIDPGALADRIAALVPEQVDGRRAVLLLSVSDPDDMLQARITPLHDALAPLGFGLTAISVTGDMACDQAPLAERLAGGIADGAPFGNADGTTSQDEARVFAYASLMQANRRGGPCAPRYSVLFDGAEGPLLTHDRAPDLAMRRALLVERFEAQVLSRSNDRAAIEAYLASCTFCPAETALTERRDRIAEQDMLAEVETGIWDSIKGDADPARLSAYLETCSFCLYQDEAEARVARLGAGDAARPALEGGPGATAPDKPSMDAAEGVLGDSEAEALASALESGDPVLIQSYLDACTVCAGKAELTRALREAHRREALRQPCLLAAGVPQLGGPRELDQIAPDTAMPACRAVLAEFPDDALARTMLGRAAQATGDLTTAEDAYAAGMRANLPVAFGLAAHLVYAPETATSADIERVHLLAETGAKRGDWLSKELLSVLYSSGAVPGKSDADAYAVALEAAEDGNTLAQFFVGYYYLEGMGPPQDTGKAAYWLDKAVRKGYIPANAYLAGLLEQGLGLDPAPRRAAELYWQAFMSGDAVARTRLVRDLENRDRDVIRFVQARLQEERMYFGEIDGIAGRGTRSAIETLDARFSGNG
ncbi:tetratricopeptide repeat protein [Anianabacter salinae]|uniref:tetratricopeptide repeat protein n=1 Tax=Anianabacter salinae TaxID=2851023 RepID=UPI00225DFA1D|nr:tetratricopeptide repeat protein [Anianabacter salinae]MBV0911109.1 sel1 repeat family protein [Anianabacter salinae]